MMREEEVGGHLEGDETKRKPTKEAFFSEPKTALNRFCLGGLNRLTRNILKPDDNNKRLLVIDPNNRTCIHAAYVDYEPPLLAY